MTNLLERLKEEFGIKELAESLIYELERPDIKNDAFFVNPIYGETVRAENEYGFEYDNWIEHEDYLVSLHKEFFGFEYGEKMLSEIKDPRKFCWLLLEEKGFLN